MPELKEIISPYLKEGTDIDSVLQNVNSFIEAQTQDFTAGLAKNRDQIKAEKTELKQKYDELNSKYSWIESLENPLTQESYTDLMSQMDTLKTSVAQSADEFSQQLDTKYNAGKEAAAASYEPKLQAFQEKLKVAEETGNKYKTQFENYQVENKLRETISKLGVQADNFWFNGLKASAKPQFGENGLESISLPDANGNLLPLEDWSKSFVNSEQGKKMIPAGYNVGGGAHGSGNGGGGIPSMEQIAQEQDASKRVALMEKYGYIK